MRSMTRAMVSAARASRSPASALAASSARARSSAASSSTARRERSSCISANSSSALTRASSWRIRRSAALSSRPTAAASRVNDQLQSIQGGFASIHCDALLTRYVNELQREPICGRLVDRLGVPAWTAARPSGRANPNEQVKPTRIGGDPDGDEPSTRFHGERHPRLAMDAVEKANTGHPGLPMGAADIATVLFTRLPEIRRRRSRTGPTATASCCRPATARCCSMRCCI